VGDDEVRRLTTLQTRRNELRGRPDLPGWPARDWRVRSPLPKEFQDQVARIDHKGHGAPPEKEGWRRPGDNSNTQFAGLGLWVARRHGVPVENALARVETRFRKTQRVNGGWGYVPGMEATSTMTCAGLLGLAFSQGLKNETVLRAAPNLFDAKGGPPPVPGPGPISDATVRGTRRAV